VRLPLGLPLRCLRVPMSSSAKNHGAARLTYPASQCFLVLVPVSVLCVRAASRRCVSPCLPLSAVYLVLSCWALPGDVVCNG
jgi:hypothetical protein